nr:zinc finger Ran-binding domain-containing protein 2-like [Penaeus vannamei]
MPEPHSEAVRRAAGGHPCAGTRHHQLLHAAGITIKFAEETRKFCGEASTSKDETKGKEDLDREAKFASDDEGDNKDQEEEENEDEDDLDWEIIFASDYDEEGGEQGRGRGRPRLGRLKNHTRRRTRTTSTEKSFSPQTNQTRMRMRTKATRKSFSPLTKKVKKKLAGLSAKEREEIVIRMKHKIPCQ